MVLSFLGSLLYGRWNSWDKVTPITHFYTVRRRQLIIDRHRHSVKALLQNQESGLAARFHKRTGRLLERLFCARFMAGCAGPPSGGPSLVSGTANPVQSATYLPISSGWW